MIYPRGKKKKKNWYIIIELKGNNNMVMIDKLEKKKKQGRTWLTQTTEIMLKSFRSLGEERRRETKTLTFVHLALEVQLC